MSIPRLFFVSFENIRTFVTQCRIIFQSRYSEMKSFTTGEIVAAERRRERKKKKIHLRCAAKRDPGGKEARL